MTSLLSLRLVWRGGLGDACAFSEPRLALDKETSVKN